ncbi:SDR family oxidoreductase [Phytohabitans sp. ZYX-F-186]|uniref:SDR family oxidoreductase n=1 Tax=Phytohabitans maris TaxID=3071409 RepID=A0ABU0ZUV8_9ACTN|nr:SDR family oxidoreductase [Phytohabitans sp. ZYX-F-186]MDQ7910829.1 SDR family oxidoreductase [Phytohabitans sp. ZYX-F-186]
MSDACVVLGGGTSEVAIRAALRFAAAGTRRFVLAGRDEQRGRRAVDRIAAAYPDARPRFVRADLNEPAGALAVARRAVEEFGTVDVLVNTISGPSVPALFHEYPIENLRDGVSAQLVGVLHLCRAVLPSMRSGGGGVIINVASDAAKVPTPGEAVIGAAMAAITMFSRTLAMEAKRDNIRVNAVTPSLIRDTGGYDRTMAQPFSAKLFQKAMAAAHLGVAEPDDLAGLIVFLASADAARITGQSISVNGGISAF